MKDKDDIICEETDYLHHMLNEQITRICVLEEEERIREEMNNK
ncbi:hypothetical protein [uncultured Metabacillus sp.]|nr:hypothetical protein [uncultured Metabacillus sp.]